MVLRPMSVTDIHQRDEASIGKDVTEATTPGSSHEPTTSVATRGDAAQAIYMWYIHFGVRVFFLAAERTPATLVADHPGSRAYLLTSTVALLVSLLTCSLSGVLAVAAIVLIFPYALLLVIHVAFMIPTTVNTAKMLYRARYDSSHCFWVAHCPCKECKGQVVGLVGALRIDQNTTELVRMFVSPRMRRQGLGRKLCQEVKQFAIANGCSRLRLTTLSMFTGAVNLYTQQGYRLINSVPYPSSMLAAGCHIVDYICEL